MKNTRITLSIGQKLALFSLSIILIPLLIFGGIVVYDYANYIETQTLTDMQNSVKEKDLMLKQEIQAAMLQADILAQDGEAIQLLSGTEQNNDELLQHIGKDLKEIFTRSNGFYENIWYTDRYGVILVDAKDGIAKGIDMNGMDFYDGAKRGKQVLGDVMQSPVTKRPIVGIGTPMYDKTGTYIGQFSATIEFNQLTAGFVHRMEGLGYNFAIANQDGIIIAHEDVNKIFSLDMKVELKQIYQRMLKHESGTQFYTLSGQKKVMAFAPFSMGQWYLISGYESKEYFKPIQRTRWLMLGIGAACVIGAGIIASLFSRHVFARPIRQIQEVAEALADGKLNHFVEIRSKDEIGVLGEALNKAINNLRDLISKVTNVSEQVNSSSEELANITEESAQTSQQVASTLEQLAEIASSQAEDTEKNALSINEMAHSFKIIRTQTTEAMETIETAKTLSDEGMVAVKEQKVKVDENNVAAVKVAEAVEILAEQAQDIVQIVNTIHSISNQTNLLALNAAIEAARAGEHGRGFSVVAEEVRHLATQTEQATIQVAEIIKQLKNNIEIVSKEMSLTGTIVQEQAKAVHKTSVVFNEMYANIQEIHDKLEEVVAANSQNAHEIEEIVTTIQNLSSSAEEAAAGAEEVSASTEEQSASLEQVSSSAEQLARLARELQILTKKFSM